MSNTPRDLTRQILSDFLPNQRAIRAFEQLLKSNNDVIPNALDAVAIEASNASSRSQSALDIVDEEVQNLAINSALAYNLANEASMLLDDLKTQLELIQFKEISLQQETTIEKSNGVLIWLSM